MKGLISGCLFFISGCAAGITGASIFWRRKNAKEVDKCLEEVDNAVKQLKRDFEKKVQKKIEEEEKASYSSEELSRRAREKAPITNYTNMYKTPDQEDIHDTSTVSDMFSPRLVTETSMSEDYDVRNLTLCADGVLFDESTEEVIKNATTLLGDDFLARFYGSVLEDTA